MKLNNLKRIYKLITSYFEEHLGLKADGIDPPNLTAIAKDEQVLEIVKMVSLVIGLAVQSEKQQQVILKIQDLQEQTQHALMIIIQQVKKRANHG